MERVGGAVMKFIPWNMDRLQDLVNLWNKELGESFPMRTELFEQNSFADLNVFFEGSQIAVDNNDNVIGFIVVKRWQEQLDVGMSWKTAWIQALLVDRQFRNRGIGSTLLNHAESAFKANGMDNVLLGRDPWHYFPGIPAQFEDTAGWFEHRGFKKQDRDYDLTCSYDDTDKRSVPDMEGVVFSLLKKEDKAHFLAFLHRCFPGRWEYEAIHYFQKGGTGREFVVLKKDEQIIGFCRINDSDSPLIAQNVYWAPLFDEELGGIGPLGIDSKERKNGYGLAIVEAAVAYLRNRNIHSILIDWTGLVEFYNKLGYEIWQGYDSYKKSL